MAAANAHAMMAVAPGAKAVYATNPLAFGVPLQSGMNPLVIDQASSATAFVNIALAAKEKRALPEGWAIDVAGLPTTDPGDAILGALLPFGGYKGGNIALMVEMLSAGLSGAAWSLDAGNFQSGSDRPDIGLSVIAISPAATETFAERATEQCNRLTENGVFVPGIAQSPDFNGSTIINVDNELLEMIREA
jgi:(2R)-3-sulfolactate dehydrogenase (NADP+)